MWGVQAMRSMKYRKAVFLDLDGTILKTESFYMKLMFKYNKIYGEKISRSFYIKNFIGKTKNEISKILQQKWGLQYNENIYWTGLLEFKKNYLSRKIIKAKYGFANLIKYLKLNKWCIAVVTSNTYIQAKELLRKAKIDENVFDFIATRNDVENVKPASDLYDFALEIANVDKGMVFAVEDSGVGLQSAQNSVIKTIYIKDICKVDKQILKKCYATTKNLKNIIKIIKREEIKNGYY